MLGRIVGFIARLVNPRPKRLSLPRPSYLEPGSRTPPVSRAPGRPIMPAAPPVVDRDEPVAKGLRPSRARIHDAFDTSMPVATRDGLAGRSGEIERLRDAVIDHHKHGIIFGARGSGKTSLSRVFGDIADEAGCIVLYNAASGDIAFTALCRPYLKELAGEISEPRRAEALARLIAEPFDATMLANLLAESIDQPTILVLDEFDRVRSSETKAEIVSLMKLLSDMRSTVRIVLVGIAANLEDVIESHPSLRRHIVSVPVAGITEADVRELLDRCCVRAGLTIDPDARTKLATAAVGSPYHLRLFGFHAAVEAERAASTHIDQPRIRAGLQTAFREWSELSEASARRIVTLVNGELANPTALAAFLAATKTRIDRSEFIEEIAAAGNADAAAIADETLAALDPILIRSAKEDQFIFEDALTPQFYLALFTGLVAKPIQDADNQAFRRVLMRGAPTA